MAHSSSDDGLQFRQDSYVEPRAYRAARWPPVPLPCTPSSAATRTSSNLLNPHRCPTPSTPRRLPRSYTAPITRHLSTPSPSSPASDSSDQSARNTPVLLTPGLSPSLRGILPHPKAVRPSPFPMQSDLSAASTRAEQEPTALRDLRSVTAPPALLDPAYYEIHHAFPRRRDRRRQNQRQHDAMRHQFDRMSAINIPNFNPIPTPHSSRQSNRDRGLQHDINHISRHHARNSGSASSLTDRYSDVARRDRWSLLSDSLRPRRASAATRFSKFPPLRNWFAPRENSASPVIPDRLCDVDLSPKPQTQPVSTQPAPTQPFVFRNERHPPDDPFPNSTPTQPDNTKPYPAVSTSLDISPDVQCTQPPTAVSATSDNANPKLPYRTAYSLTPLTASKLTDNGSNWGNLQTESRFDQPSGDPLATGDDALRNSSSIEQNHNSNCRNNSSLDTQNKHFRRRFSVDAGLKSLKGRRESTSSMRRPRQPWNTPRLRKFGGVSRRIAASECDDHEGSLMSALTNESDVAATARSRSMSEAVLHRRLSLVPAKDKVLSMWDRFVHRRRSSNTRGHQDCAPQADPMQRTPWLRFRVSEGVHTNS